MSSLTQWVIETNYCFSYIFRPEKGRKTAILSILWVRLKCSSDMNPKIQGPHYLLPGFIHLPWDIFPWTFQGNKVIIIQGFVRVNLNIAPYVIYGVNLLEESILPMVIMGASKNKIQFPVFRSYRGCSWTFTPMEYQAINELTRTVWNATYRSNAEIEGGSAMNSNSGGGSLGTTMALTTAFNMSAWVGASCKQKIQPWSEAHWLFRNNKDKTGPTKYRPEE